MSVFGALPVLATQLKSSLPYVSSDISTPGSPVRGCRLKGTAHLLPVAELL